MPVCNSMRERVATGSRSIALKPIMGNTAALRKLRQYARAAGIPGMILLGPWSTDTTPMLHSLAQQWPMVSCGMPPPGLHVPVCAVDHYYATRLCVQQAHAQGSRRPGLVYDLDFDELIGGYISSAFLGTCAAQPDVCVPPVLTLRAGQTLSAQRKQVRTWCQQQQPDAVITMQKTIYARRVASLAHTTKPKKLREINHY